MCLPDNFNQNLHPHVNIVPFNHIKQLLISKLMNTLSLSIKHSSTINMLIILSISYKVLHLSYLYISLSASIVF